MSHLRLLASLALRDLWHDRKVSFCMMASLVAVIAPLLLLFGLKHGVISQMQSALLRDPVNLEIRMLGNGGFSQDWVEQLRARPDIGFAIGQMRSLSAMADLMKNRQSFLNDVEVIPTASNDPLLPTSAQLNQTNQVVLSHKAAERLQAQAGDELRLRVARKLGGRNESGEIKVLVGGVLDPANHKRHAVFVSMQVQVALEHFFDGRQVLLLGVDTGVEVAGRAISFARARIYARDIDSVAPLEAWLNSQRIETSSRLHEITNIKAINQVLGLIFGVIATTALIGCLASLIGSFIANIDRKRKDLAVLRLLGFKSLSVAGYVLLQALLLTTAAFICGLAIYGVGSRLFDYFLGSSQATGEFACHITLQHMGIALALVWTVATAVSFIGALRAIQVQPAESLREL